MLEQETHRIRVIKICTGKIAAAAAVAPVEKSNLRTLHSIADSANSNSWQMVNATVPLHYYYRGKSMVIAVRVQRRVSDSFRNRYVLVVEYELHLKRQKERER